MTQDVSARRRFEAGLLALAVAVPLFATGGGALAWIATAVAVASIVAALHRAERGVPLASRSAALHGAVSADLLLATVWEGAARFRRVPALARAAVDVENAVTRWRESGWLAAPQGAFAAPPPLEKIRIERRAVAGGGDAEHLCFASEFEPADPEIAVDFLARRENRSAHVLLWRHAGAAPRPTLIVVHGFGMGRLALDLPWLRLRGLDWIGMHRVLGIDVAYVILPFHGPRSDGTPSGRGFFDVHPLFAPAALAQAVWELRRIAGWLRAQGAPAVGVHGLSLGGCTAALFAAFDPTLACAVPMCPAVDLAEIFWRQLPPARRRDWTDAGLGPARLAAAWSLAAPLRHRPVVAQEGRLVIGAIGDQIATPSGVEALWRHWDEPSIHWLPGAHLAWLGQAGLQTRLAGHLRATLLAEPAPLLSRFRS
jgi:hypothetical protein